MKGTLSWKAVRHFAVISVGITTALIAVIPERAISTEPDQTAKTAHTKPAAARAGKPADKSASSQKAPGMRIYVDPTTGEISKPSSQPVAVETLQRALEMTKDPPVELFETPSPRPGGGVMLDLKGRFRNPLTATRGVDGKLSIQHRSDTSGAGEKK